MRFWALQGVKRELLQRRPFISAMNPFYWEWEWGEKCPWIQCQMTKLNLYKQRFSLMEFFFFFTWVNWKKKKCVKIIFDHLRWIVKWRVSTQMGLAFKWWGITKYTTLLVGLLRSLICLSTFYAKTLVGRVSTRLHVTVVLSDERERLHRLSQKNKNKIHTIKKNVPTFSKVFLPSGPFYANKYFILLY